MKIRMVVTVDVDPKAWTTEFPRIVDADGNFDRSDFRDDVRSHVRTTVHGALSVADEHVTVTVI